VPAKGNAKNRFAETLNPLKNLKTAKSGIFRAQGYQALSKTLDFAGETISFRFGAKTKGIASFFVSREILGGRQAAGRGPQKFGKPLIVENGVTPKPR